jgi:hypothetical protein
MGECAILCSLSCMQSGGSSRAAPHMLHGACRGDLASTNHPTSKTSCFRFNSGRTTTIRCQNADEFREWFDAITKAVATAKADLECEEDLGPCMDQRKLARDWLDSNPVQVHKCVSVCACVHASQRLRLCLFVCVCVCVYCSRFRFGFRV